MNMCRVTGPVGSVAVAATAEADGAGCAPPVHAETMNARVAAIATDRILTLFPPSCGPITVVHCADETRLLPCPLRLGHRSRVGAAREIGDRRRERIDVRCAAYEDVD